MTVLRCEKKKRLDHIVWINRVTWVWCVNDNVMYEMNYERLICCSLVEIENYFMKKYIFLNSLAYSSCFVVFVLFLNLWWSCITCEQGIW